MYGDDELMRTKEQSFGVEAEVTGSGNTQERGCR